MNTDFYNTEMDQTCKEAFRTYFSKGACYILHTGTGKKYFMTPIIINLLKISGRTGIWSRRILCMTFYEAAYWYFDFDGDGMPELIFDLPRTERPYILQSMIPRRKMHMYFDR